MMPTCHGAGGLAGQHRLGANTGLFMVALGVFKILLGLMATQGLLLSVLDALPISVLGILVILAGHELAASGVIKVAKEASLVGPTEDNRNASSAGEDGMVVCLITGLVRVRVCSCRRSLWMDHLRHLRRS